MKKSSFLLIISLVTCFGLLGCTKNTLMEGDPQDTINTGNESQITGTIAIEDNDITTLTSGDLLYHNKKYGFTIIFTNKANGVKVHERTYDMNGHQQEMISFYWPSQIAQTNDNQNDGYSGYDRIFDIQPMDHTYYNSITEWGIGAGKEALRNDTWGLNDTYYFVVSATNAGHKYLSEIIPALDCKSILEGKDCGNWLKQLVKSFTPVN